jgi:hypothetical protein
MLAVGALFAALTFFAHLIWNWDHASLRETAIDSIEMGATFGCLQTVLPLASRKDTTITIDGDMIVTKKGGKFRKMHVAQLKTIRLVREGVLRDGGLFLSDRGRWSTFLRGPVVIPEKMPGIEEIKKFAETGAEPARP